MSITTMKMMLKSALRVHLTMELELQSLRKQIISNACEDEKRAP